jgi:hypothetical protein
MTDATEPRWHPNVSKLAHSIAAAYTATVPSMTPPATASLWEALVPAIGDLLVHCRTHEKVGDEIGDVIEAWERRFEFPPGPRRFVVASVDDVVVAPLSR